MSTMPSLGNTLKPPEPVGARDEVQNALQWLARMTRSFVASSGQEAHVLFDADKARFVTPEVSPSVALELALPDVVLQFTENGTPSPHAMNVDEKSSAEIEAWLLSEMLHRGFERENFSKKLPYRWEHLLSGDERKYAPSSHVEELRHLTDSLVGAARVLLSAAAANGIDGGGKSSLLCWPERLEIGFISPGDGGAANLEIGYLIGDEQRAVASSYFVRPVSGTLRMLAPSTLGARDTANDDRSVAQLTETLTSMIAAARVAAAH